MHRGNKTTRGNEFINQNHEQNTRSDLLPRKRLRTHAHTSTTSGLASKIATVGTLAVGGIITTGALMVDVVKDYDVGDNYIVYELNLMKSMLLNLKYILKIAKQMNRFSIQ